MAVNALARILADIAADGANGFCDAFAICNLRFADTALDFELTNESVNDYVKMQLAYARKDRLTRFLVRIGTESGILLCKLCKRIAEFLLTCLCF